MGTRTVHGHPDSDSSGVCKNQAATPRARSPGLRPDPRVVGLQVETTPELFYVSLGLALASVCSTGETRLGVGVGFKAL